MGIMLADSDFDILIKGESRGQHAEYVKKVFERINEHGFMLSEEKCEFFFYLEQV